MTDVEREMAWTSWRDSCRNRDIYAPDLRLCRRRRGHDGEQHASGFGKLLRRWT